jgi:threonine 3-dehydrogenase
MIAFKVLITPLQRMATTIPSSCRVPHFVGNKEIKFEEKAVPEPGPGQLLLRVCANALCGSERPQFFDGAPVTPRHEAADTVVAAGPGTHTPLGTTGAVFLMDFCGECRSCRLGFSKSSQQCTSSFVCFILAGAFEERGTGRTLQTNGQF